MNSTTLIKALRALKVEALDWRFALYSTSKGRDGLELTWHLCHMNGIAAHVDQLREYLLKKPVNNKPTVAYSPFLPAKESIGALAQTNELIREQIKDLLAQIRHGESYAPEDFLSGVTAKPAGFAFYGERQDAQGNPQEQVLFMRRGNPFLGGGGATQLFTAEGNQVVACRKPVLKFTLATDFLLLGKVGYFFSDAVEKDFALESRHLAIARKRLGLVAESSIINNYDQLEAVVMKPKQARKFIDYDQKILEHIARLPLAERQDFLSTYGITLDQNGLLDTYDAEQCELIIDLLCGRSCLDPLGRLSVVSNLTPRE